MTRLPGILGVIAEITNESVATRLALAAGGTVMTFSARANGRLAKIVGAEAAKKIATELGAEKYTIPMAHLRGQRARRAQAAEMLVGGATLNEVAKACDVHERTARRVKALLKEEPELPLFAKR